MIQLQESLILAFRSGGRKKPPGGQAQSQGDEYIGLAGIALKTLAGQAAENPSSLKPMT
jgi:hypothetical protein